MTRLIAAALAALALGACASSPTPLLTGPDPKAPVFAEGMWAATGAGCDLTRAASVWPACALKLIVTEDKLIRGKMEGIKGPGVSTTEDELGYRLADGAPVLVQLEEPPEEDGTKEFNYYALRPVARNEAGAVTRADIWPVSCPDDDTPTPGFTKSMMGCTVASLPALRARATVQLPLMGWSLTWVAAEDRTGR